jgi:hypothetical protein
VTLRAAELAELGTEEQGAGIAVTDGSSLRLLFDLTPKIFNERSQSWIVWQQAGKPLGVFQRGGKISRFAAEAGERLQYVAIV